ncbi:HAD family hydrolase [Nocardiopsis algeriensis]|uniref:HAD family hydrolase n=1 Tax=Nocardiopsis algeriensis TaxID=1478215 RepID=UPI003B42995B
MITKAVELMRRVRAVLLDFDGPMCSAFAGYPAHEVAEHILDNAREAGLSLPSEVLRNTDPMQVLRHLYQVAPQFHVHAERLLRDAEVRSVLEAKPGPGAVDFLEACKETGRTVAVVSNNSPESVTAFLDLHDLNGYITSVHGREKTSPDFMKPHPYLLKNALQALSFSAEKCLMVGDSTADIKAAHTIGVPAAGYANRPGKTSLFEQLGSEIIIHHMEELTEMVHQGNPHHF